MAFLSDRFCRRALLGLVLWWPLAVAGVAATAGELSDAQQEAIASLPRVPANMNRGYRVDRQPAKHVRATLGVKLTYPQIQAERWVFAMTRPPQLPAQDVLACETQPPSQIVTDQSPLQRQVLRSSITVGPDDSRTSAQFRCETQLQLYSRSLVFGGRPPPDHQVEPLTDADRSLFLRPSDQCDYPSEAFQSWKQQRGLSRQRREGEIDLARRVFQNIVNSYQYSYVPQQDRTASSLCAGSATDCGGMATLFVTSMRSEGVPARVLVGRWAKSAVKDETVDGHRYFQYHVIAEFYAQGVGWIPVDPSSAVLHDKTPDKLRHFGQDSGNFVVLHVDTGVEFDSGLYGDYRAIYFQIPVHWLRGSGTLQDRQFEETWVVEATR